LRAQDLTSGLLDKLYGDLLAGGQSAASVNLVHAMGSGAYKRALKRGEVSQNPLSRATPPSAQQAETASWTLAQAREFFAHDAVRDHPDVALFRLLWATGMRRGEAVALRWEDVDLVAGTVAVRRNATSVGGQVRVGAPKTERSRRTVKLGADSVAMLREHRARQDEHRLAMGAGWNDIDLVFPALDGTLMNPQTVSSRFTRLVERTGVPRISLHGLRHAAATLMLERGLPVHAVASRLGHDPAVLLRRYSHAVVDSQDAAAQLETLLDGEQPALRVVPGEDEQPDDAEALGQ
jgi:integrase